MTVKECIEQARDRLNGILVPAALVREIGSPLIDAIDLLTSCVDAINEAEAKEAKGDDE